MREIGFILAAGLTLLTGCATHRAAEPVALRIAVNDIYCRDTACFCVRDVAARGYTNTLERIKLESGIDLRFTYFIEPYQLEDAILSGEYDGALSKPWTAIRLEKRAGASFARVVDVLDPGDNQWLTGIVIVPVGSPIESLEELNGKQVFIGQDDAYEKHQAANKLFKKHGVVPAKIGTNASCGENIGALMDEEADAAVISDYALSADCAVDFANPEDFRTLGRTERIPLTSLMLDMNKVDPGTAERLRATLLSLSGATAPEELLGRGFVAPAPWNPEELEESP